MKVLQHFQIASVLSAIKMFKFLMRNKVHIIFFTTENFNANYIVLGCVLIPKYLSS